MLHHPEALPDFAQRALKGLAQVGSPEDRIVLRLSQFAQLEAVSSSTVRVRRFQLGKRLGKLEMSLSMLRHVLQFIHPLVSSV